MSIFIDMNYPGVVYQVIPGIVASFIDHMTNEGACLHPVSRIPSGWEVETVLAVREDPEYWGLILAE